MLTVFGSINLDISIPTERLPRAGETVMGGAILLSPGGKGANQAHAAKLFGVPTRLFGIVGKDPLAAPALENLITAGVDISGVQASPSTATGVAVVTVCEGGDNAIVVAAGANSEAQAKQVSDEALRTTRVLLLQLEVPPDESFKLARRAAALGCKVILNPSPLSPSVKLDTSDIDMVMVNELELDIFCQRLAIFGIDPMDQAKLLADALRLDVLVTLGAEGAFLMHSDGRQTVSRALSLAPVDTTGAGDTFAGVFAAAIATGETPQQAMDLACVAAGLACMKSGAQIAQPSRASIDSQLAIRAAMRS